MFNPVDFFTLAKKLDTQDEARVRTIISRAYYASFLLARDKFSISLDLPEVHKAVAKKLYSTRWILGANKLQQLRTLRNNADYNTLMTLTPKEAQKALRLAGFIIDGLKHVERG